MLVLEYTCISLLIQQLLKNRKELLNIYKKNWVLKAISIICSLKPFSNFETHLEIQCNNEASIHVIVDNLELAWDYNETISTSC